ncbi:MAG: tetratricopeptide repeat protein, partial [Muribaculaceae bacterium]|nr:tetratricopeptide repeat protein [Muribaculaceae bacterium]
MKFKLLFSFLLGSAFCLSAQQGYKDGIEYFRADQPEEAEIILQRTINDPATDKAEANYYLGLIELQKGNAAQAKTYFDNGVAANPANPFNLIGLGAVELKNGNKSAAEAQFKAARQIDKNNARILVDIARAYYNADPVAYAKDIEKTLVDARKAAKKTPEPAIYILEGDMLAPTNVGDAAGYYEMAQQADPNTNYPEAYVKYARTYFVVNPKFSIDKLNDLLAKQPNSALAQRELAEKYYESDRLTLAAEQYGKYMENPNHFKKDEIRYVALLHFGKKYQDSYDLAGKILGEDPENIYMQRMQFLNLEKLGKHPEAIAAAQKFLNNPAAKGKIVPNDYTTLGDVYTALGQDTLAAQQFENAVAVAPDRKELLKDLSGAYTKAKMYREAADAMQRFVDEGDASTNDRFMLARRYQNMAATETDSVARIATINKALKLVDDVLEKVPDNPTIVITKARML